MRFPIIKLFSTLFVGACTCISAATTFNSVSSGQRVFRFEHEDQLQTIGGSLYNARTRTFSREDIKFSIENRMLKVKGSFRGAVSKNSSMNINIPIPEIDISQTPVMEIHYKISPARRDCPLRVKWIEHHGGKQKAGAALEIYPDPTMEWQTSLFRMDVERPRYPVLHKFNRVVFSKSYSANLDVTLWIDYIIIRPLHADDRYVGEVKVDVKPLVLDEPLKKYPILQDRFHFGLWGIRQMRFKNHYDYRFFRFFDWEHESIIARFRSNYMDAFLAPMISTIRPRAASHPVNKKLAQLNGNQDSYEEAFMTLLELSRKYRMTFATLMDIVPRYVNYDENSLKDLKSYYFPLIKKVKDSPEILGWYLADEPPLIFQRSFYEAKKVVDPLSDIQPLFINLYSEDSIKSLSTACQLLMTDHYPIRPGCHNPWSITDWCNQLSAVRQEGQVQHLILGTFEMFSQDLPKPEEFRLQCYSAIANGADSLYAYTHSYAPFWIVKAMSRVMVDAYGNTSPLWEEAGQVAKVLLPIGPLFAGAERDDQVGVLFTNTNRLIQTYQVKRPEIGMSSRTKNGNLFVFFWNNNLDNSVMNTVTLSGVPQGYSIYDLIDLKPVISSVKLSLSPGGGRILILCKPRTFPSIAAKVWKGRAVNELMRLQAHIYTAHMHRFDVADLETSMKEMLTELDSQESDATFNHAVYDKCLQAIFSLDKKMKNDRDYVAANETWENNRRKLGQMSEILTDCMEAPKVAVYRYDKNPIDAKVEPGKSYFMNALLLSLAFRDMDRVKEVNGVKSIARDGEFLREQLDSFLAACRKLNAATTESFAFTTPVTERLIELAGEENWKVRRAWLKMDL